MSRRRLIGNGRKDPVLVKLTSSPGSNLSYTFLSGYKYVDMLIVGGGGAGGTNSAGGGASGTLLYVKNLMLSNLSNKTISYNLAKTSSGDGNSTMITLEGETITVTGGGKGGSNGFNGSNGGHGGHGGSLNETSIISTLTKYVSNVSDIAIANNGGGSGGYWYNPEGYGYAAGSGATMSNSGKDGSRTTAGGQVNNGDGTGGNRGGNNGKSGSSYGYGYRRNTITIPVVSVFKGGGTGGKASNGLGASGAGIGGGAAGYMSGGDCAATNSSYGNNGSYGAGGGGGGSYGGSGGQGIICFYYHN